jgi:YHS domain-containing protein
MKSLIVVFLFISSVVYSQQDYNTKKGFIAGGYDVVAYFSNKSEKGNKKFTTTYDGVKFKFISVENLKLFTSNPKKYTPQYGGFCAYAIGKSGDKVSINPKTFEIRDGKLYLFYNAWGTNTLEFWSNEGPKELQMKADQNWEKLQKEK